ncbi:gamma-tubulin complex component 5 [Phlebotomus argentipes]|uniref:gamma-tubulin complex component 5 n=1 Tax=Phlebotomus argentipes TaxID=94469 RepID=UPI0028931C5A|nr:gamma-tubulin complex component 5 [Phlebotomus argentipes]
MEQQAVFEENLPKLIKSLTGFNENDKNYRLCRDFARSRIRGVNSNFVSTNEVKRKILSIAERLDVENLGQCADMVKETSKILIENDGQEHNDSHENWKILDLILTLSKNPIEGAKKMRSASKVELAVEEKPVELVNPEKSLAEKATEVRNADDTEDELSEWSESEEEVENPAEETDGKDLKMFLRYLPGDEPAQHRESAETSDSETEESSMSASLSDRVPFSLLHCPIREVIWMFFHPDNCNFYCIANDTVKLREDADLSNVIVFRKFMADFTEPMTIVLRLRTFCRRVLNAEDAPPQVYFIYAEALKDLLHPMEEYLLEAEKKITPETMHEPETLLNFCYGLEPHLQIIKSVAKIHASIALEWKYYPRYICSAFMQAKIFHIVQNGLNRVQKNVAASLFTCVIQFYLQTINSWWSFGKIFDEQKQFIVKDISAEGGVVFRSFQLNQQSKNTQQEREINELLSTCPILQLLKTQCEKIEERLDAIHTLSRAGNFKMRTTNSLCQDFLKKFLEAIEDYLSPESVKTAQSSPVSGEYEDFRKKTLEKGGKLLLEIFEKSTCKFNSNQATVNLVLRNLMERSQGILPLERMIMEALNDTLNVEIQASDKVMVDIYTKELNLLHHFRIIRNVFLLEDSSTMFTFYTDLFENIETRPGNIHPLSLTFNLRNVLSTKYPEDHGNFCIDVASLRDCKSGTVLEVIRQISLIYKMTSDMSRVFDETSMRSYNRLFVFLLSIKWSVWTLESLKFTKSFSMASPYAVLTKKLRNNRRLAIIRSWILYALNNIHYHLMSEALEHHGHAIEQQIATAQSLQQITTAHHDYLETLLEHCFQKRDGEKILTGVNQLIYLVQVVRSEWLAIDKEDFESDTEEDSFEIQPQIDQIEKTYVECHRFLSETLNQEVAINGKTYLSGLVSAFDRRLPY